VQGCTAIPLNAARRPIQITHCVFGSSIKAAPKTLGSFNSGDLPWGFGDEALERCADLGHVRFEMRHLIVLSA